MLCADAEGASPAGCADAAKCWYALHTLLHFSDSRQLHVHSFRVSSTLYGQSRVC
jgi:hypothetical protein